MDITITISLNESQQRAIETQLARSQSTETMKELVTRIATKVINGWANQNREEFVARNRPMVDALVERLSVDPDRDDKLAALGVRFVDGVLQPVTP